MVDLILYNGRITTLDPACPEVSALAIRDGLVAAAGTDPEVLALQGASTRAAGFRTIPTTTRSSRL